MSGFDLAAGFLIIIGVAGWINARVLHLPTAAAMVVAGLISGGALLFLKVVLPSPNVAADIIVAIGQLNFPQTVLGYMLGFLLFAGAMHVDVGELRRQLLAIFTLATLGVMASTVIVGLGSWLAAKALGFPLSLPWALVFGTLISPTDPIAVLAAVRQGGLSRTIEAILQGEALFNDGVGIVFFTAAVAIASGEHRDPLAVMTTVAIEAVGGLLMGWLAAWVVVRAMRAIDDYAVEVVLSLGLAIGLYAVAGNLHLSGPIAVVAAGLVIGNSGIKTAMSDTTQRYVRGFWTLIDEILNALLFLLLGLELLVVPFDLRLAGVWLLVTALVLIVRLVVVLPWGAYFQFRRQERGASALLAWGGLHGALSLALALSLPQSPARELILSTTFAVVIFSVLVQGVSFGPLARRLVAANPDSTPRQVPT